MGVISTSNSMGSGFDLIGTTLTISYNHSFVRRLNFPIMNVFYSDEFLPFVAI